MNLRKKGFTLVESITALFIITIVIIATLKFYTSSKSTLEIIENQSNSFANLKIAEEFVISKIKTSNSVNLNSGKIYIDGNELYVKDNILRYKTSSQQISPNIKKVYINCIEENTYEIIIEGDFDTLTSTIKRGEYK